MAIGRYLGVFFLLVSLIFPAHAANNERVAEFLRQIVLSKPLNTGSNLARERQQGLRDFYASRSYKPVWSRDSGPKGKARALVGELKTSVVHGLSPDFYHIDEIERLMKSSNHNELARLDMLLTGALVDFTHDLINGRIAGDREPKWNAVEHISISPVTLIEGAADAGNLRTYLTSVIGEDRRYVRLIAKVAEYERLTASSWWPKGGIGGPNVRFGKNGRNIPTLRNMLALLGDLPLEQMNGSTTLDEGLSHAIRVYQERHGAAQTGQLDDELIALLNQSIASRIVQLKLNLDRRRWQNRPSAPKSLYLNLSDGSLKVSVNDKTKGLLKVYVDQSHQIAPTQFAQVFGVEIGYDGQFSLLISGAGLGEQLKLVGPNPQKQIAALKFILNPKDIILINDAISNGGRVNLLHPVELYITYLTAWATRNGVVHFRPDIFERDVSLAERLLLNK